MSTWEKIPWVAFYLTLFLSPLLLVCAGAVRSARRSSSRR